MKRYIDKTKEMYLDLNKQYFTKSERGETLQNKHRYTYKKRQHSYKKIHNVTMVQM